MATEGQRIAIRDITNRMLTLGSVSFALLDNIDTLTAEEATILISNYRPRKKYWNNSFMGTPAPKCATPEQKKSLLTLLSGLSGKEQTELFEAAGARFFETLTITQADWCIRQLTYSIQNKKNAGHA